MKIALVHHWLVAERGGERVFEALAGLFDSADIFTLVYDPAKIPPALQHRPIHTSLLQHLPRSAAWRRYYLPLFPAATERLNLKGYDLIISSDAATVKGVRTDVGATHVCYCHTPMRYVWNGCDAYRSAVHPIERWALSAVRRRLREWDYEAAQRVTHFVANSKNVQNRIQRYYKRDSILIYPPVDTDRFTIPPGRTQNDFYLLVSQLVPYKRADIVVEAFNECGKPLIIIGDGPERAKLERRARSNIRFAGRRPQAFVVNAMQECKAFVFAGEEDFGIVMVEAQSCGKPVVALGRGGAVEIVEPGVTGVLFCEESAESLLDGIEQLEHAQFDPEQIRTSVLRFGRNRFLREFSEFISRIGSA